MIKTLKEIEERGPKMGKYNYAKLNGKIVEIFGSQRAYASYMGWAERTASEKLNCRTDFKQSEIERTIEGLGLSKADIPDYFFVRYAQAN